MAALSYHPEAKDEIREAAAFYEQQKPGLGDDFLREIEALIGRITSNPLRFAPISGGFRCCRARRFPYGIIYAIEAEELFVVAVAHLKRKPEYWRQRLGQT